MTVDEAKNKVCPMIFFEGDCIGPECMAWRWNYDVDGIKNKAVAETIAGELIYNDVRVKLPSTTDGYCGLAGKEGTE
jgi:hypothetical protein